MSWSIKERTIKPKSVRRKGHGLLNKLIDKLPVELHLPGYQFCGPGTKLTKRLERGDRGINLLDAACREHDIAYQGNEGRHEADKQLFKRAWARLKSKDASLSEKSAALIVAGAMKGKTTLGMGIKRSSNRKRARRKGKRAGGALTFANAVRRARKAISGAKGFPNVLGAVRAAYSAIRNGKAKVSHPTRRIIPIPKSGGFLPLIPLFAALGAIGSLGGGAAAIAKAVNAAKGAKDQLQEASRHNRAMEEIAVGKGLYIKPFKSGCGLYISPHSKNC